MNLPDVVPQEGLKTLDDLSVMASGKNAADLDKALVSKALMLRIAQDLPDFYEKLSAIAISAEHESDSVAALKLLLDRVAGKASQDVNLNATLGVYQLSQEEIASRLSSLRAKRDSAVLSEGKDL